MKKLQVLTLVAALALGGGSVFATVSKGTQAIEPKTGFELDIQDEEIAKAFEADEVNLILESDETPSETTEEASNDEFQIIVEDPEMQKALDAGEVTVIFESDEESNEISEGSDEGFEIIFNDPEMQKALDAGEVTVIFED